MCSNIAAKDEKRPFCWQFASGASSDMLILFNDLDNAIKTKLFGLLQWRSTVLIFFFKVDSFF